MSSLGVNGGGGVFMRLEFQTITPMSVQIPIFIGEVGQSEVSDGLVHSLKPSKSNFVSS